ncbi:hypothetical protein J437_LFUL007564 [Ladona fulva]|uniref:Netrin receptor UNC5 n=1 Tax=Ladona fulva TaxID=123851 RepID=A0A8K0NYE0_LADFU|nr:hypothetical protein J437_LFUL007564 [Ladona fulva]
MTSRLSYASSPESDLDLCPEPTASALTPNQQQVSHSSGNPSGVGLHGCGPIRSSALKKSNSDPSIATHEEDEDAVRGLSGDVVSRELEARGDNDTVDDGDAPGYNAPPPYSPFKLGQGYDHITSGGVDSGGKRRLSHGGDGKYGFPPSSISHHQLNQQRHCSPLLTHSPPHSPSGAPSRNPNVPDLPPRVDRTNKPGRSPSTLRSATERLFGAGSNGRGAGVGASASQSGGLEGIGYGHQHQNDGNYMNAQRGVAAGSSLERPTNKGGHESMSSSYDSFNRLGPNAHDDLKSGNGTTASNTGMSSLGSMQRLHDPYRFTRSTAQPIREAQPSSPTASGALLDYSGKYSRDHRGKPGSSASAAPPVNNIPYKPIPPPKPKNYRPPQHVQQQDGAFWNNGGSHLPHPPPPAPPSHSRSYSAHIPNGGNGSEDMELGVSTGGSLERNHMPTNADPGYPQQPPYGGAAVGHIHMQQQRSSPMAKPPRGQFYYNVPPPHPPALGSHRHHHHHHSNGGGAVVPDGAHGRELSGLDLTNREQRGSAFELYKKPNDPRLHFVEHGVMRGQFYYNVPPPHPPALGSHRHHHHHHSNGGGAVVPDGAHGRELSGLDLTNREQRGSAFELYKKPNDPRLHFVEHGVMRSEGMGTGASNGVQLEDSKGGGKQIVGGNPSLEVLNGDGVGLDVVEAAEGVFGSEGGRLDCRQGLGVSLVIPPGALPEGSSQKVYLRVTHGGGGEGRKGGVSLPPLDADKGEAILSPLVFCGPQGLQFKKPVELILPHSPKCVLGLKSASIAPDSASLLHLSVRAGQTKCGQPVEWENVDIGETFLPVIEADVSSAGGGKVSIFVDHF